MSEIWDSTTSGWDDAAILWNGVVGADTIAPTSPASLTATAFSSSQINLSWTAATDNVAVTGYDIYRGGVLIASVGPVTTYPNTGLSPLTLYSYAVKARDAAGNTSAFSPSASATTPAVTDTTNPTPPTTRTATAISSTQINLVWSGATDNVGVTGYEIYRNTVLLVTLGAVGTFSDTTVAPLTTYTYNWKSKDAAGNVSALSAGAVATTPASPDITPPTPPPVVTATVISSTRIDLSWSGASDDVAVTGYRVIRDTVIVAVLGLITSYTDAPLTPETTYSYTIRALDAAGNVSDPSDPVERTTLPAPVIPDTTPPSTIASLLGVVFAIPGEIELTWSAATDNIGVTGYEIYRNGVILVTVAGQDYTDSTPVPGIEYSYTVRARDAAGNFGEFSVPFVGVVPIPVDPVEPPPGPIDDQAISDWGADRGALVGVTRERV